MTHPVETIVERCVVLIEASDTGASVFAHRRDALSEVIDELPMISVDYGADEPSEFQTLAGIGSSLTMPVTAVVKDKTEALVRAALLELRRQIHIALQTDRRLGLDFVVAIQYRGAEAPEIDVSQESVVGSLTSNWLVHYRMSFTDPGN